MRSQKLADAVRSPGLIDALYRTLREVEQREKLRPRDAGLPTVRKLLLRMIANLELADGEEGASRRGA